MVKKLLKYDLMAMAKSMLPMEIILLATALFSRVTQLFESDTVYYNICFISSVVLFCVAVVVSLVMVIIVTMTRFYRNLYTAEGYLSFTLPVTTSEHIFSKLISGIIFSVINLAVILISTCIITFGDVLVEIIKSAKYILVKASSYLGKGNLIGYSAETVIFLLVAISTTFMLIYACITLGQTAKKNRILAAFGVYFAYYIITQIISTVFIIICTAFGSEIEKIMRYASEHIKASVHVGMIGMTVFALLLGVLYYFITHLVMRRKLNLE